MNKKEFLETIVPVAEYYGRAMSEAAFAVYYESCKHLNRATFDHLVRAHIADPDHGRYFPTFSHLVAQAGDEKDIARQAGVAFDDRPNIDGTGWFDVQQESKSDRDARKRRYVARCVDEWKGRSAIERIAHSSRLPDNLKQHAIEYVTQQALPNEEVANA